MDNLDKNKIDQSEEETETSTNKVNHLNLLQVIGSVLAAMFGVQSDKNRHRDFQQNSPTAFIIVGIILVIALIITMLIIVNTVISTSST